MATPLRKHLILQLDRGDTGVVVLPHGANNVEPGAVAGVGIGDQRHIAERGDDHPRALGHLGLGDEADVGQREARRRHAGSGQVGRDVSGAAGELSGYPVENAWGDDEFVPVE